MIGSPSRLRVSLAAILAIAGAAAWMAAWGARTAPLLRNAAPLLLVAALGCAAWGVGELVLGRLGVVSAAPRAARIVTGFALLSFLWLALGLAGLLRQDVAWGLLGAGVALAAAQAWHARRTRPLAPETQGAPEAAPAPRIALLPLAIALAGVLCALPMALAPPASTDELTYHLTLPKWYAAAGRLLALPDFSHAAMPAQVDLLFGWALLLGSPVAAKLVHATLAACGVALAAAIAAREGGRLAGACAAALMLATPAFLLNASWAVVDAATATSVLLGTTWLFAITQSSERSRGLIVAAGIAWGMALGTKYASAGYFGLAALVTLLPWRDATRAWRSRLRDVALVGGLALALTTPWLARNALTHGNPLHPMGDRAWGTGQLVNLEEIWSDTARETGAARLAGPLVYFALNERADDQLSPAWLAALLALLVVPLGASARRFHLVALGAVLGLSFAFEASVRLQLPALLLLAIPAGQWLGSWLAGSSWRRAIAAGLLGLTAVTSLPLLAWHDRELFDPVRVAFGFESRDAYLARMEPAYPLMRLVDESPEPARVLTVGIERLFWLDSPVVATGPLDLAVATRWSAEAGSAEELVARLRREGITHVLADRQTWEARALRHEVGSLPAGERSLEPMRQALDHLLVPVTTHGPAALYRVP